MLARIAFIAIAATLSIGLAAADSSNLPNRIRGTVASFSGDVLTVRTDGGEEVRIQLPAGAPVSALANRKLSDIKAGDYVGSAAVEGSDGKLHAQEVHIFAEAMRGAGEGHKPMSGPKQSMTNATVSTVVSDPKGQELRLTYPGGEQDIEIEPDTRIVAMIPGDRSLLKPGAEVAVFVNRQADGTLTARAVQAEKDGVPPL